MPGEKTPAKGKANMATGSVKKAVGKATKNRSLQAKGTVQKVRVRSRTRPARRSARSAEPRGAENERLPNSGATVVTPARPTDVGIAHAARPWIDTYGEEWPMQQEQPQRAPNTRRRQEASRAKTSKTGGASRRQSRRRAEVRTPSRSAR